VRVTRQRGLTKEDGEKIVDTAGNRIG
jgi:hypothetical protein